jgi:hypothetical protein
MSNCNMSQRCGWPNEQAATMTGSVVKIATLAFNPVHLIFDNQGTASVAISVNDPTGATVWRTFSSGEAIILDMRANHGIAANFTSDEGTTFYGNGASGTFSISYTFAESTT